MVARARSASGSRSNGLRSRHALEAGSTAHGSLSLTPTRSARSARSVRAPARRRCFSLLFQPQLPASSKRDKDTAEWGFLRPLAKKTAQRQATTGPAPRARRALSTRTVSPGRKECP